MVNTVADGVTLLESLAIENVVLLADLFHMNIEEVDIAASLRAGGQTHRPRPLRRLEPPPRRLRPPRLSRRSSRRSARSATTVIASAEALPYPDPDGAARQTIDEFRKYFG